MREAIVSDIELMIDANLGYDAIEIGRRCAEYNIHWFAEPVVPEVLCAYRDVRKKQPILVAAGETWHGRWAMDETLKQGAVDILQPDICGTGGLSEARKITTLSHVRLVPHVWGTAVALAVALHFHAILPPSPPKHTTRSLPLEFDRTHNPFRHDIVSNPIKHKNGVVSVPTDPGLEIKIDRAAIEKHRSK